MTCLTQGKNRGRSQIVLLFTIPRAKSFFQNVYLLCTILIGFEMDRCESCGLSRSSVVVDVKLRAQNRDRWSLFFMLEEFMSHDTNKNGTSTNGRLLPLRGHAWVTRPNLSRALKSWLLRLVELQQEIYDDRFDSRSDVKDVHKYFWTRR